MSELRERLPEIRLNRDNPVWLDEHADELYDLVRRHVREQYLSDTARALQLLAPHFLHRPMHRQWEMLMFRVLNMATETRNDELQRQLHRHIGLLNFVSQKPKSAVPAFKKALTSAEENTQEKIEIFIGLLQVQLFLAQPTPNAREELLQHLQAVYTPYMKAVIYGALAQYHFYRGEYPDAVGYAQTAYSIWFNEYSYQIQERYPTDETRQYMARELQILASSCRELKQYEQARKYLQLSQHYTRWLAYKLYYIASLYEEAVIDRRCGDPNTAIEKLHTALDALEENHYPAYSVVVRHGLGMAYLENNQLDDAEFYLQIAHDEWQKHGNTYEAINALHGVGYVYLLREETKQGQELLNKALQAARQIEQDSLRRDALIARIQEDLDTLT